MQNSALLTNKIFGELVVIQRSAKPPSKSGNVYWQCRCSCGAFVDVRADNLRKGYTRSCGCLRYKAGREKALRQSYQYLYRATIKQHRDHTEYIASYVVLRDLVIDKVVAYHWLGDEKRGLGYKDRVKADVVKWMEIADSRQIEFVFKMAEGRIHVSSAKRNFGTLTDQNPIPDNIRYIPKSDQVFEQMTKDLSK